MNTAIELDPELAEIQAKLDAMPPEQRADVKRRFAESERLAKQLTKAKERLVDAEAHRDRRRTLWDRTDVAVKRQYEYAESLFTLEEEAKRSLQELKDALRVAGVDDTWAVLRSTGLLGPLADKVRAAGGDDMRHAEQAVSEARDAVAEIEKQIA